MKSPLRTKYRIVSENGVYVQSCIAIFPIWFFIVNGYTGERYNFKHPKKAMRYIKSKKNKTSSAAKRKILYQTK